MVANYVYLNPSSFFHQINKTRYISVPVRNLIFGISGFQESNLSATTGGRATEWVIARTSKSPRWTVVLFSDLACLAIYLSMMQVSAFMFG